MTQQMTEQEKLEAYKQDEVDTLKAEIRQLKEVIRQYNPYAIETM